MVFVNNLPYSVRWQQLKEHMSQAGNVAFARILTKQGVSWGSSLGTACVRYETPEEAREAFNLSGSMLVDRAITVEAWTGVARSGYPDGHKSFFRANAGS